MLRRRFTIAERQAAYRPRGRRRRLIKDGVWRYTIGRWCHIEYQKYKDWGRKRTRDDIIADAREEFELSYQQVQDCWMLYAQWERLDKKHKILQWF